MEYSASWKQQVIDRWTELKTAGDGRAALVVKQEFGVEEDVVQKWSQELHDQVDRNFVQSAVLRNRV